MATASKVEEVEPKTGVSFQVTLDDGKKLHSVGVKRPAMLGVGIKVYAFGMYADNEKFAGLLKSKMGKCPEKPTKEMFQLAIDGDFGMMVRMSIVFSGVSVPAVKKNFAGDLGASIKKLNGGKKNDELANKLLGSVSDDTKITTGSVLEISRLPGHVLEAKLLGEVVNKVESELLSRAFVNMYLGESDVVDKEAKEKFGASMLSLF